jgi:hypothetical protein
MRLLRWLCCAVALAAFVAPAARADQFNKLTYLTFSGPVQIPGVTLAPGTYMFKLADSMSTRHIVQVFDKDGSKLYATLLAIPDKRMDPPEKNIVLFGERPAGSPQAIKAWWYPGDSFGDEFVYPKSQAMKIAKDVHQPVLSMEDEGSSDRAKMKDAKVGRVNENGEVTAEDTQASAAPSGQTAATTTTRPSTTTDKSKPSTTTAKTNTAKAPKSSTAAGTAGTAGTTAPSTAGTTGTTAANRGTARELPHTASNLPLAALLSGLALAGAASVRQLRKRAADRA